MSLELKLNSFATAVGTDIKALLTGQGSLSSLSTTAKANLVAAINELKTALDGLQSGAIGIDDEATTGTTVTWSVTKINDILTTSLTDLKDEILGPNAAAALDTLKELAAAIGDDPNFAATLAADLNKRVRFDAAQTLTSGEKIQARANIEAASATDFGALITGLGAYDADLVAAYNAAKA